DEPDAFMAPQTALGSNQMGKFVYVVGAGDKAEQRLLTLGPMDGDLVSVTKGLREGDRVIVGNLQKIAPGSPVKPLLQEQKPNP
ncbi:MAG: efflux transporter periplasmic adaptor subunit, partial [Roseiarcus sp.]